MNPHNQLGMCSNWRVLLLKANAKRRLLERQVETLEIYNPAPPLGVTQRVSSNISTAMLQAGDLQSKPALRQKEVDSVHCPEQ